MGNKAVNDRCAKVGLPFTFEQVLDAIKAKSDGGPEGFTSAELAMHLGVGQNYAQQKIKESIMAGRLRFNGHRKTTSIDGKASRSPVYVVACR